MEKEKKPEHDPKLLGYLAMIEYLEAYYQRGKSDEIGGMLGVMSFLSDGEQLIQPSGMTGRKHSKEPKTRNGKIIYLGLEIVNRSSRFGNLFISWPYIISNREDHCQKDTSGVLGEASRFRTTAEILVQGNQSGGLVKFQ